MVQERGILEFWQCKTHCNSFRQLHKYFLQTATAEQEVKKKLFHKVVGRTEQKDSSTQNNILKYWPLTRVFTEEINGTRVDSQGQTILNWTRKHQLFIYHIDMIHLYKQSPGNKSTLGERLPNALLPIPTSLLSTPLKSPWCCAFAY